MDEVGSAREESLNALARAVIVGAGLGQLLARAAEQGKFDIAAASGESGGIGRLFDLEAKIVDVVVRADHAGGEAANRNGGRGFGAVAVVVGLQVNGHTAFPQGGNVDIKRRLAQWVALQVNPRGDPRVLQQRRDIGYGVVG